MTAKSGNLEAALTALIHSQATLARTQAAFVSQLADEHRRLAKNEQDMAEVKSDLEQIKGILIEHSKILAGLPEGLLGSSSCPNVPPSRYANCSTPFIAWIRDESWRL